MLQTPHSQMPVHHEEGASLNIGAVFLRVQETMALVRRSSTRRARDWETVIVFSRPATYASQGKILVQSQQIPIELVRPTVTATAAARIQVIEQRVMTRDNLLAIVDKFHVFAGYRNWYRAITPLSGTEALDLARQRGQIKPIELELRQRQRTLNNPMAFSVSFEHENA